MLSRLIKTVQGIMFAEEFDYATSVDFYLYDHNKGVREFNECTLMVHAIQEIAEVVEAESILEYASEMHDLLQALFILNYTREDKAIIHEIYREVHGYCIRNCFHKTYRPGSLTSLSFTAATTGWLSKQASRQRVHIETGSFTNFINIDTSWLTIKRS